MIWNNKPDGFGLVAILFHWLGALLALGLFGVGVWMVELDYYSGWYHLAPSLHKSVGVLLFLLTMLRMGWCLANVRPVILATSHRERQAAKWVHSLLYGFIVLLSISGYLLATADGNSLDVFSLLSLPAVLAQREVQEELAGEAHEILAYLFVGLVLLHFLAAMKHHFINRDRTLMRMIFPRSTRTGE